MKNFSLQPKWRAYIHHSGVDKIYPYYAIQLSGYMAGWAMKTIHTDNMGSMATECVGILTCTGNCSYSDGSMFYRPDLSASKRTNQIGKLWHYSFFMPSIPLFDT